jgi:hypothetical protein
MFDPRCPNCATGGTINDISVEEIPWLLIDLQVKHF